MKSLLLFLFSFVLITSCAKSEIANNTPDCIIDDIKEFEKTCCEEGANVKEYRFQGELVYVFDPGTCGADMTSEVKDEECNSLGHLGGISGNTTINGEDFSSADFKRLIWEN